MSFEIKHGDCREVMATLEPESIDAIVSDPPYGLSDDTPKDVGDRILGILRKIGLPNLDHVEAGLAQAIDLHSVPLDGSALSWRKSAAIGVHPGIGVPERPVDLEDRAVAKHEVDAREVATVAPSDPDLATVGDADPIKHLGDYVLDARDAVDLPAGDVLRCGVGDLAPSGVGVAVVAALLPGRGCLLSRLLARFEAAIGDDVWPIADSRRDASGSPGVRALPRAVLSPVAALDASGTTLELSLTESARHAYPAIAHALSPKLVRAFPRAGGLPSVAKAHRVRVVEQATNRTLATLDLWLHVDAPAFLRSKVTSGGFMGKGWDHGVPGVEFWTEALRVAKPGAHLLAFGGTRTYHRLACAIEDAGWEVRDCLMWVYGSGFPKSLDVSDAMEKWLAGERLQPEPAGPIDPVIYRVTAFLRDARDKAGWTNKQIDDLFGTNGMAGHWTSQASQPAVPSVARWAVLKAALGFGDELDDVVAQIDTGERGESDGEGKEGTFLDSLKRNDFAESAGGWGTALKPAQEIIVLARKPLAGTVAANILTHGTGALNVDGCRIGSEGGTKREGRADAPNDSGWANMRGHGIATLDAGRWPSNFLHDGSAEVTDLMRDAARFFYCAKPSREDRESGLREAGLRQVVVGSMQGGGEGANDPVSQRFTKLARNTHPTVKPTDLMRYLCRLVTPPGGLVLDPFTGSGSTGKAALLEGFRFLGIEREAEYVAIARARCEAITNAPVQYDLFGQPIRVAR